MRAFLALISLLSLAPQHLGSGDSIQPRDTVSIIESISPPMPEGVRFSVVGADTYLRVEAQGHDVEILGYEGEPYLRVRKSGEVQLNDSSQTTVLNSDRYGNVDLSNFKKSDIPRWRTIASNGVAMWHDHRSHWMSPIKPAVIDNQGTVLRWSVPVTVDGVISNIHGTLYLRSQASFAWWGFALAAGVLAALLANKKYVLMQGQVFALSIMGIAVGMMELLGLPSGARITPILLLFSIGAAVLSVAPMVGSYWKMKNHFAPALIAGAASAQLVAAWLCIDQVRASYVPGLHDAWPARVVLTMMIGTAAVVIADAFLRITKVAE